MTVVYPRLNNIIATIPLLTKLWFVETYVTIKKPLVKDFYNVLRFIGDLIGNNGKSLPSIFIRKSNAVLFNVDRITTSRTHNVFAFETPMILNVGVRFHVRVEQVVNSSGQHYIRAYLNHVRIKHGGNYGPSEFQNVKVFVCDSFYDDCTGIFALYGLKYGALEGFVDDFT